MRREVPTADLQKRYTSNDMAKVGCNGCAGCSRCCEGMGESIVLDPMDVCRLCEGLNVNFGTLLERQLLEIAPVDGLLLVNLKMQGNEERCGFLNEEKRCSIHAFRPGVCRLFPLGRIYEDGGFQYFLQHEECSVKNRSKVKISKWLGIPNLPSYEKYVLDWHNLTEEIRALLEDRTDEQLRKDLTVYFLEIFYAKPYGSLAQFYGVFENRAAQMRKLLKQL